MKKQKVYYYHDMKNDDFATTNIETVKLPDDYKYIKRNFLYNFLKMSLRLVVYPIIYLILWNFIQEPSCFTKGKKSGIFSLRQSYKLYDGCL